MIAGRQYWIIIWYLILALGVLGLGSGILWGRRTHWKHMDEVLRAIGTIAVSLGMLLLLNDVGGWTSEALLVASLICFLLALISGRRAPPRRQVQSDDDIDD